jgi:nicotinate phosphoribosyltransferase
VVEVNRVRELLDSLGATNTKITVTNDLDEFSIAALAAAPVDAYGVGTSVATGSGAPTAGFVYKLVSFEGSNGEWQSVAKKSSQKTNIGGRKNAIRRINSQGIATAEVVASETLAAHDENDRELTVNFVHEGEIDAQFTSKAGTDTARAHHKFAKSQLPLQGLRLMRGDAAIVTELI